MGNRRKDSLGWITGQDLLQQLGGFDIVARCHLTGIVLDLVAALEVGKVLLELGFVLDELEPMCFQFILVLITCHVVDNNR